jgi:hypothetical protein
MSAYPQKRTSLGAISMSALGQKRTLSLTKGAAALPPKAAAVVGRRRGS